MHTKFKMAVFVLASLLLSANAAFLAAQESAVTEPESPAAEAPSDSPAAEPSAPEPPAAEPPAAEPPAVVPNQDGRQDYNFYIGARFGFAYHIYTTTATTDVSELGSSFSLFPALSFSYNFIPVLAVQAEFLYNEDEASFESDTSFATFGSKSLIIPILVKLTFQPGRFIIGPFAGPYGCISLAGADSSQLGIIGGFEGGMHLGPGDILIDIRYAQNLINSAPDPGIFRAGRLQLSVGYRIGFYLRRKI